MSKFVQFHDLEYYCKATQKLRLTTILLIK